MPKRLLIDEAHELLAEMQLVPPREGGEPLRWQDKATILRLRDEGWSQDAIATEVACHQSTVSRILADLDDSRPFARRMLEASATAMAEHFIANLKHARASDIIKMLGKLDVIRDEKAEPDRPSVQVVIGIAPPGTPQNPIR